jgi:hypothetical protein
MIAKTFFTVKDDYGRWHTRLGSAGCPCEVEMLFQRPAPVKLQLHNRVELTRYAIEQGFDQDA